MDTLHFCVVHQLLCTVLQGFVTLSVTEVESAAATQCTQDVLFNMRVIESMGLKVKKLMILEGTIKA